MSKKNIILNLLVLLLLFIMVRAIIGGDNSDTWNAYRNYVCSCRIATPANWIIDQEMAPINGGNYGIYEFGHPQLLTSKYVRVYFLKEEGLTADRAEGWVQNILVSQGVEGFDSLGAVTFGAGNYPGQMLGFSSDGWEGRIVFMVDGSKVFAVELEARSFSKNQEVLFQILDTFETFE